MITVNFSPNVDANKIATIFNEISTDKMSGFLQLPRAIGPKEIEQIKTAAKKIIEDSEYLVCVGIGGSYLGHRAVIEALRPNSGVKIIYAGKSLSRRELYYTMEKVGDKDFSINVISKSGTTLETSMAFSAFKQKLIEKYGEEEARKRIYVTTDANNGALHDEATTNGYQRFVIPDNVGGRYSVLSVVGLLPMAVTGIDIDKLLEGAVEQSTQLFSQAASVASDTTTIDGQSAGLVDNPAVKYAWMRYTLAMSGYDTEVFASFEPFTEFFNEWLKQLFGESEGKNGQGIWPASVIYSTDLHSLGQFMQEGRRNLWETIIDYPTDEMNMKVVRAVQKAHTAGGIPVLAIGVSSYDEKGFGELIYFFELACAISAKLFGVNPFDQPGVEAYKDELKKLL